MGAKEQWVVNNCNFPRAAEAPKEEEEQEWCIIIFGDRHTRRGETLGGRGGGVGGTSVGESGAICQRPI